MQLVSSPCELVIQWLERQRLGAPETCRLDSRNTVGVANFDGADGNWESWRVKFEAHADPADMAHLDVVAEQSSFIRHDGLDDNSLLISRTVRALLITICDGKAFCPWSHCFHDVMALRHLRVAQRRVRGQGWNSHSSACERHLRPTCQMGKDV